MDRVYSLICCEKSNRWELSFSWLHLWSHWDGWLWDSGVQLPGQTHWAWTSLLLPQPGYILQKTRRTEKETTPAAILETLMSCLNIDHKPLFLRRKCCCTPACWQGLTVSRLDKIPLVSLTCCEGMTGIQTHSNSALVPHFVYDSPQLGELATHCAALTAHILQHWANRESKGKERGNNVIHSFK